MNPQKLRMLLKAFIESQFSYCPLVWMFHSCLLNNNINKLHERALRLVYKDTNFTFRKGQFPNNLPLIYKSLQLKTINL